MADTAATLDAVGRGFDLYKDGPVAFAGFVGWLVALWFIRLYVRQAKESRDLTVQLILAANNLGDVLDRVQRVPRRRKPVTNPGFKLPEPPE